MSPHDVNADSEPAPGASLATMHRLAKSSATAAFANKLVAMEMPTGMARTLSRAVVDPTDARRRLERPTPIRVPGGIVYALETTVWATAAAPYVVNNREARDRHFPAGANFGSAEAARYKPLRPPVDSRDGSARLRISANEPKHLLWSLERSAKFLLDNNNWTESIGSQGVMQQVTLAVVSVAFESEDDPVMMLGSIDGSSRINSAHAVLGLTPSQVVFEFPRDERAHRQYIANLLTNLDRPADDVAADDIRRLRALEVPARIFVRYEPDEVSPVTFSKAVESYVHLVHVEPPRPWDEAASLDAKADSVLNELQTQGQITQTKKAYYEGMLSPEEASAIHMRPALDERALEIVALISNERTAIYRAVREGILLLSKGGQVRKEPKAEIAVELALRGVRSNLTNATAKGARETLKDTYLHSELWAKNVKPTSKSPEDLRDEALEELDAGKPGRACRRIAAQGAFWLAIQRILREARFFSLDKNQRDPRSPRRVLTDLMNSPWGIQVLHRAIVDGRDNVPIVQVDDKGTRQKGVDGKVLEADHQWLREQVVPQQPVGDGGKAGNGAAGGGPALPDRQLLTRLGEFKQAVDHLEDAHTQMREVKDAAGHVLVDQDGIATDTVNDLRERLENLRTDLVVYGKTWKEKNEARDDDPVDEESAETGVAKVGVE